MKVYIVAIAILLLLCSSVAAQDIVVSKGISLSNTPENKTPVLKEVVKNMDDAPSVLTTLVPTKGEITLSDEGKVYAIAPVTHAITVKSDADREAYKAEYVAKYAKVVGHNTVTIDNKVVVLDILDMAYLKESGLLQLNLSATVDGKEKRIRNPVKIRSPPVMVFATADNAVEDPTSAILESLAYIVQGFENGEPTFSDGDPVMVVYAATVGSTNGRLASETFSQLITGAGNTFYTNTSDTAAAQVSNSSAGFLVYRYAVPFNTSGLYTRATIENASINVYGYAKSDGFSITPALGFTRYGGVADFYTPAMSDYNKNMTGSTRYGTDIPYASFSTTGYNTMYFNSVGINQINYTGPTPIVARIDNDIDSVSVSRGTSSVSSYLYFYTTNYTGTTRDPYLSITYGMYDEADDDYTVSLLHFDGVNNGVNFTDQYANRTWTPMGPIVTATNISKFPSASGYSGVSANYLSTPYSQDFDFGSGDFTIDGWVYPINYASSSAGFFSTRCVTADQSGTHIVLLPNGGVRLNQNTTSVTTSAGLIQNNSWSHLAVARSGNNLLIFVNGQLQQTGSVSGVVFNSYGHGANIGSAYTDYFAPYFSGYLDEVRITKGLARWNANFTPPTTPYELITDVTFTATPDASGTAPVTVQFNVTDPSGFWTVNTYNWSFGDGNFSTDRDPSHTYVWDDVFTVTQNVTNNNMTATYTKQVPVGLDADFTASPVEGSAALLVTFTDTTTNTSPVLTYSLDFGDGTTTTEPPNADGQWIHVYSAYGVFSPNLTVTNDLGTGYEYKRDYIIVSTEQNTVLDDFQPQTVQFSFVDSKNNRVLNAPVNASVVASSFPSGTSWLVDLYSMDADAANEMLNGTLQMQGSTDNTGSIVFTMQPSLEYNISILVPSTGITQSRMLYPIERQYTIHLTGTVPNNSYVDVGTNASCFITEPNASYVTFEIQYSDASARTSLVEYYLVDKNNETPLLINYQSTVPVGDALVRMNYTLPNVRANRYSWFYNAVRVI